MLKGKVMDILKSMDGSRFKGMAEDQAHHTCIEAIEK